MQLLESVNNLGGPKKKHNFLPLLLFGKKLTHCPRSCCKLPPPTKLPFLALCKLLLLLLLLLLVRVKAERPTFSEDKLHAFKKSSKPRLPMYEYLLSPPPAGVVKYFFLSSRILFILPLPFLHCCLEKRYLSSPPFFLLPELTTASAIVVECCVAPIKASFSHIPIYSHSSSSYSCST